MNLPDSYIVSRLTPVFGRDEARAIACWIAEEPLRPEDRDAVCERVLRHEPLAYIFGHTDWRGLRLQVSPATLIPRPETAELVDHIGRLASLLPARACVLDIGTGSGCIAIALKKDHPDWEVFACDISREALAVAQQNAVACGAEVHFFQADILSPAAKESILAQSPAGYDLIVSNPPYICEEEKVVMEANVLDYEPATALFVPDADPLLFYRAIARLCAGHTLAFEINERFGALTADMLRSEGYTGIQIIRDICGKERIVSANR